jgi:5-methyltetrahydrofolate--homocysteine methyltransferase
MEFEALFNNVVEGNAPGVEAEVKAALANNVRADDLLDNALVPAMAEVGRLFEEGEIFVPEMLVSARAMQGALNLLRPLLAQTGKEPVGRVVMGTVAGDLHDIGKNLVGLMLEGAGFEVIDLGVDVSPEKFVEAAKSGVHVIGLSALLTTTMPSIKNTVDALVEAGVRDRVKVVIGGAPVTTAYAEQVGADAFAPDAANAVRTVKGLLKLS